MRRSHGERSSIPRMMSTRFDFLPRRSLAPVALSGRASSRAGQTPAAAVRADSTLPQETHLTNVKQLTYGGENAEAYFSFDGQRLSFQSTRGSHGCDQIYTMKIDGSDRHAGQHAAKAGRRAASTIRTASICSTRRRTWAATQCPPPPSMANGLRLGRVRHVRHLPRESRRHRISCASRSTPGYDAEATIAKDGRVVFTSVRDGDMEIYSMNGDGTDVRRLTNLPGPDGGAFFSPDGSQIVFRGRHPPSRPGARRLLHAAQEGAVAADVARDLRDESRRQQSPAGHAFRQARTGRRTGRPTASASSSRRT